MNRYILSLDQGTTSSRSIIFDHFGRAISMAQQELTQYTPLESQIEHDANEIWESQVATAQKALLGLKKGINSIDAIGITNQRETSLLWERKTGKPIGRAIVWQCRRSADICRRLKEDGHQDFIHSRTGLMLDPYFSATKILWHFEKDPTLAARARNGDVLFGTIDSWLLWKFTGGKVHATDISNASRTMLMNLEAGAWDAEILSLLGIPIAMLPEIRPSVGLFGQSDPEIFGRSVPITGIAGDQHAALFGHQAFSEGDVKNTYGTGCFILMNVGKKPVRSSRGLLSTVAWGIKGKITYALEGSVFMGGALLQWLRDDLNLVENVQEIDRLAREVNDTAGVYLVPSFQGLGTPWWEANARGALLGLTRAAKKNHICRAFLESIAYRSRDVIDVMIAESDRPMGRIKVDGGASRSEFLMQFQADLLGMPVERPEPLEITALGVAMMAAIGAGIWHQPNEIPMIPGEDRIFKPQMTAERRNLLYEGWLKSVKKII